MTISKCIKISGFATALLIGLASITAAQDNSNPSTYPTVAPASGESCLICGVGLEEDDTVLMVRGRRVPLKSAMVDSFMNNQAEYFSQLQPKGALFQEELSTSANAAQGGIRFGWFLFGSYVLVALVFSGLSGYTAISKGLAPIPHFFIGFFLSAFGYLYVLTRPSISKEGEVPAGLAKVPVTSSPIPCPSCSTENHPSAKQCSSCGTTLESKMQSEVERAGH